jgi:V8-like Glu-specific endopeptidase
MSKSKSDRNGPADGPLPVEALARMGCLAPSQIRPKQFDAFVPLSGVIFDDGRVPSELRVGFQRLKSGGKTAAWLLSANSEFRHGLPLLERRVRTTKHASTKAGSSALAPEHRAWNARLYTPPATSVAATKRRNRRGHVEELTAPLDALIFGVDDRRVYFPSAYPWNCVGRLERSDGSNAGSAALVGRDLVLTAKHCVENLSSVRFVAAYYNGRSATTPALSSWASSMEFYDSDEAAWDFALLRLYQPLGDYLGYFGVKTYDEAWNDRPVWAAAGYPSMSPFNNEFPSYLLGVAIDDAISSGDAAELESEDQDNSLGNSGGPVWAVWSNGPHIVGVVSRNEHIDLWIFGDDYQVLNASGKAMVDLVALGRLEIDTSIKIKPPEIILR